MTNLSEIQINGSALRHNVDALRAGLDPKVRVAAVVKSNAYGHGLREVVTALDGHVDAFQVDDIEELRQLRRITQAPALVFGYVPRSSLREAVELGCELAVYDVERIEALGGIASETGLRPKVHLKIDALLGRQGVLPADLDLALAALLSNRNIEVVAAYAHFANLEDTTDLAHAQAQVDVFDSCWQRVRAAGWPDLGRHISATSGRMVVESSSPNDMVRLGVGIYGMYPSAALARSHAELYLRPVARWITHLAQVKTLPFGHPIGYGLTFISSVQMRVGIIPQGYADGVDRGLSNVAEVLVRGRRCRVLGRIAMNMFAIDLSEVSEALSEDEVVLLGQQGDECITAEEIALKLGTINYEIVARMGPGIPRILA